MSDTANSKNPNFFTIFVFPFNYGKEGTGTLLPKDAVAKLVRNGNKVPSQGWAPLQFDPNKPENYSEYYYFYPFVRSMLFDKGDKSPTRFLTRTDYSEICTQYLERGTSKRVRMSICSIDVHLYENQIGVLSLTTENSGRLTYGTDELLRYNDLTRRVYPPFLRKNEKNEKEDLAAAAKGVPLIPQSITISGPLRDPVEESFKIEAGEALTDPPHISSIVGALLHGFFLKGSKEANMQGYFFEPFTDDRMFVISYLADRGLSKKLSVLTKKHQYGYESSDIWHRFVFVDGGDPSVSNEPLKRELLKKNTYARWAGVRTLYGMTRYSLVALCNGSGATDPLVYTPMKGCYYQMALLILFQRAMLLQFSEAIKALMSNRSQKVLFREARELQRRFINFTTRYSFAEVTPQEQGIEMYDMWADIVKLDELYEDVKEEVHQLAAYVQASVNRQTDERVKDLTVIIFVLTIWLVFFGDHLFKGELCDLLKNWYSWNPTIFWTAAVAIVVLPSILVWVVARAVFSTFRDWLQRKERR